MSRLTLALLSALTLPAYAAQNACELVKPEEINLISATKVDKVVQQKSGNPSECGFLDSRKAAVLVVTVRDVQYAVKDELFMERDNLEKIYKNHSKPVDGVGDGAYWMSNAHQLGFRKGKTIVNVKFGVPKNQNELDTAQIARVIETRLAKTAK
jgi:hypothetical protein